MEFRTLRADEIECRVANIGDKGLSLLLYKDARCDMSLLDEVVGPMNWKRSHTRDNANCFFSIWDATKNDWVSKEDTGTESNTEAQKGLASDSFKRACFNWGIGRELYTAPFIWIPTECYETFTGKSGKPQCKDKFAVDSIGYSDRREIDQLTVINCRTKQIVFQMGRKSKPTQQQPAAPKNEAPQIPQTVAPHLTCNDCGSVIINPHTKTGEPMDILDYQAMSKKFFGRTLCRHCMTR